jgi:hypothetical protein
VFFPTFIRFFFPRKLKKSRVVVPKVKNIEHSFIREKVKKGRKKKEGKG